MSIKIQTIVAWSFLSNIRRLLRDDLRYVKGHHMPLDPASRSKRNRALVNRVELRRSWFYGQSAAI